MTGLGGFIADAGLATGSAGGVKARAEHGARKDQADLVNEHGEDFEQLVAGAEKAQSQGAGASSDVKADDAGSGKSRPAMRAPGAGWHWVDERTVDAGRREAQASEEASHGERADLPAELLPDGRRTDATVPSGSQKRESLPVARDGVTQVQRQRPALDAGAGMSERPPVSSAQSGFSNQAGRPVSQTAGIVMQPGAVEPATAQLAAVLSRGSETGKPANGARGTAELPKIQVSLAETHFSPVKPDSELEAYDLARRIGRGQNAEDPGRLLNEKLRQQGVVRPERSGRPAVLQRDVRAEQLIQQNASKAPAAGDIGAQIGTRILQELEQSRPAVETRAAGPVHVKQSDPVLKVLEIRLEPRELGTVLVRMSLRDNVLQVELGFGKTDAAAMIAKNTDQLTEYLRSSGYVIDDIVVRVVEGDRAPAPVMATGPSPELGQASGGPSNSSEYSSASEHAFDDRGDQRQSGREGRLPDETSGEGSHGQDNSLPRSGSGLFV